MLNSHNRLKRRKDFDKVFKKGKSVFSKIIGVKALKNSTDKNRYGIIIGTKVSKSAVKRNLIKRRIRAVLREENNKLLKGYDIVIITLPEIKNADYIDISKVIYSIFKKHALYQNNKQK